MDLQIPTGLWRTGGHLQGSLLSERIFANTRTRLRRGRNLFSGRKTRFTQTRVLISIVASLNLELHQLDVKTAFLYGYLDEELYEQQPEGFIQPGKEHLVFQLHKPLYGLKQSTRK
jgi:hypothetical protein